MPDDFSSCQSLVYMHEIMQFCMEGINREAKDAAVFIVINKTKIRNKWYQILIL